MEQRLKLWNRPPNYIGAEWHGWYVVLARSRDSNALERANFDEAYETLKPMDTELEDGSSSVLKITENHWAVGWVQWIGVHNSNTKAAEAAANILECLESYPALSEDRLSQYEDEECRSVWERMSHKNRADYLRRRCGRNIIPPTGYTKYQTLKRAVNGDWSFAAHILPAPSDLLYC